MDDAPGREPRPGAVSPDLYESLRAVGTEVVEIDGGHWLPLTAPGRVADEVRGLVGASG